MKFFVIRDFSVAVGIALCGCLVLPLAANAQMPDSAKVAETQTEIEIDNWLTRLHNAAYKRSYVGTFVVMSAADKMSSSRIWHVCNGVNQMERVEALTGAARSTFRRDDRVVTFFPELRIVRSEKRESLGLFPHFLQPAKVPLSANYRAYKLGEERVAGVDTDVVMIQAKDRWRFGYRVWSERQSGLAVKLQTSDGKGHVLEQAAFSELQLDASVPMPELLAMMENTKGYQIQNINATKVSIESQGWRFRPVVAGFSVVESYKRAIASGEVLQWIVSDGLATVSLFIEPYSSARHLHESQRTLGATHMLTRRIQNQWWLTAVGEVPISTLQVFVENLERLPP